MPPSKTTTRSRTAARKSRSGMATHPSATLTRRCQGRSPPERLHRGIVAADAAHAPAATGARAREQDPFVSRTRPPRPGRRIVFGKPRPGERAVEDIAGGQAELALEVLWRLRLQARPALGVACQAFADRLGQVLVERVEVALDEGIARALLVGGEEAGRGVQSEDRQ